MKIRLKRITIRQPSFKITKFASIVLVVTTFLSTLVRSSVEFDESQLGIQIPGPIYAGGLSYSTSTNKIYFTGSLHERNEDGDGGGGHTSSRLTSSKCFLGEISLSSDPLVTAGVKVKHIGQGLHHMNPTM